jgi:hypothetical protein
MDDQDSWERKKYEYVDRYSEYYLFGIQLELHEWRLQIEMLYFWIHMIFPFDSI